jgi:hypothetical protein
MKASTVPPIFAIGDGLKAELELDMDYLFDVCVPDRFDDRFLGIAVMDSLPLG